MTLLLSAVAVPINTVFGVTCAILIARNEFPGKLIMMSMLDLPFSISPVVTGLPPETTSTICITNCCMVTDPAHFGRGGGEGQLGGGRYKPHWDTGCHLVPCSHQLYQSFCILADLCVMSSMVTCLQLADMLTLSCVTSSVGQSLSEGTHLLLGFNPCPQQ